MRATYKRILLEEPNALPGYILPEEGHKRRKVTSAQEFKEALREFLPGPVIDAHADYPIGIIEGMYGAAAGLTGKKLKSEFERLIAGSVTVTNDEPFIRAMTKKEREQLAIIKVS